MSDLTGIDPAFAQWLTTWGQPASPPVDVPPPVEAGPPTVEPPAIEPVQPGYEIPAPEQVVEAGPPPLPPGYETEPTPLQPGLGIPASAVEQSMAPPPIPGPEPGPDGFFDPLAPASWDDPLSSNQLVNMGHRDPIAFAQHRGAMEEQRAAIGREQKAIADAENSRRAEAEIRDLREANDKAARLHEEVLNTKIDPSGRRGTARRIADVVAVMIGGLVQARKGGPNVAMQIIDSEIDRDIEAQKSNLLEKRNAIAELRQRGMSDFQAQQAYRVAWYSRALDDIRTEMQNYDPRGTAAMRMAQQTLEIEGRIQMAGQAARKSAFEDDLKIRKDRRETLDLASQLAKRDAETAKLNRAGMGAGVSGRMPPEYFEAQGLRRPPMEMSDKEYKAWLGNARASTELTKAEQDTASKLRENEQFESEQHRQLALRGPDGAFLLGDDDKPAKMKDVGEAKELTQSIADTDEYLKMMDEVLRLRRKHGWSSDLFKSPEWRRVKTLWGEAVLQKKDVNKLGALTGSDLERLHEAMGASDPTSLRDPTPGIETARRLGVSRLQTNLRARGIGEKYLPKYPETWKNQAPAPTALDEAIKEIEGADNLVDDRPGAIPIGPTGAPAGVSREAFEVFKAQTSKVRDKVQFLEDAARSDGANAKQARQALVELQTRAASPVMRDAARQALRNLDASASATKEEAK